MLKITYNSKENMRKHVYLLKLHSAWTHFYRWKIWSKEIDKIVLKIYSFCWSSYCNNWSSPIKYLEWLFSYCFCLKVFIIFKCKIYSNYNRLYIFYFLNQSYSTLIWHFKLFSFNVSFKFYHISYYPELYLHL